MRRVKYAFLSMPRPFYQYGGMGFLYWAAMAATSFTTVYLQGLNFTAMQIGTMSAAFTSINIVAPPLWGIVSDKLRSVKKVFAICVAASAVFWFILPHSVRWFSPLVVLIILPLNRFVGSPTMALLDSWIVRHVNRDRRVGFGPIRLWGSVGFCIVAFIYGMVLENKPIDIIFYGYVLFAIPCVIIALSIKEDEGGVGGGIAHRKISLREMQVGRIIKTKPLMAYLLFNLTLYTPVMATFTFMPYLIEEVGGLNTFVGVTLSVEALLEIIMLIFSARLLKRFKITRMIIFVGFLYTAEVALYSACGAPWHVLLVKAMHGLGYGLYLSCTVQYIYRLAPKGLTATAQTFASCSSAIAGIIGNLIGGAVIDKLGARVFFGYSSIFMVFVVAAYAIWMRFQKDQIDVAPADVNTT
ncbi:MAG: MFS transporter [Oscillospiraceae bacterium]|nr:MFS transporter [Oscillospiraceae bacterium]